MSSKNNPKMCAYCAWADKSSDDIMLCYYKGPVCSDYLCRKYKYDPYKRKPEQGPELRPAELSGPAEEK